MLPSTVSSHRIEGRVIRPDDPAYDRARLVAAAAIDHRPAMIVKVSGADDVARVIALAREHGLELAVRGGGHSPAGHGVADGGVVIDLSELRAIQIDATRRTAWAGTGLTAAEYTAAAGEHGLATGFGDTGSVGIGGLTLSGGIGFLVRKHGLTIDDLLAAEVVTAAGEVLHVDGESHPDLFWALRGGGGNFGVATRLKLRLHPVDTVTGGMLMLPASADVIAAFVAAAAAAPEELTAIANVMPAPPLPFLAPEQHGRLVVAATIVHAGDVAAGERAVAPFRALAEPVVDMVRPQRYPELYPPVDESYRPLAVARALFRERVDERAAGTILAGIARSSATSAITQLRVLGGAMARVSADATAFAHRDRRILTTVAALYGDARDGAVHTAWAAGLAAELRDRDDAAPAGFLADEGVERVRAAYPGATWERLAAIKAEYDPDNVFRLNQNIAP